MLKCRLVSGLPWDQFVLSLSPVGRRCELLSLIDLSAFQEDRSEDSWAKFRRFRPVLVRGERGAGGNRPLLVDFGTLNPRTPSSVALQLSGRSLPQIHFVPFIPEGRAISLGGTLSAATVDMLNRGALEALLGFAGPPLNSQMERSC